LKDSGTELDPNRILQSLDKFIIEINKIELQIKDMQTNKSNQILKFIKHIKTKFLYHVNKLYDTKSDIKNDNKLVNVECKKKNVDHLFLANLHSPLLKSKMMHFEQILINSDHYQYNSPKKKDDVFKLVGYKTEMLKKLKRGLKNINKTFNTYDEEQILKHKRRYKSNTNTKSFKTSTNSDRLPNVNESTQFNNVLGPNNPNKINPSAFSNKVYNQKSYDNNKDKENLTSEHKITDGPLVQGKDILPNLNKKQR